MSPFSIISDSGITLSSLHTRRGTVADCKRNGRWFDSYSRVEVNELFFLSRFGEKNKSIIEFRHSIRNASKFGRCVGIQRGVRKRKKKKTRYM